MNARVPPASLASEAPYEMMSATLLSQQPPALKGQEQRQDTNADWGTIFTHLESRLAALRNWRWSWWSHWARLAEFFNPRRYTWLVVANRMWKGSPINDAIIDSTGALAVKTCSSGMWSGMTNPTRPWIKIGMAMPWIEMDADGKEWLEDTEQRIYTVLAASNFYTTMAQGFEDLTVFGTAPVLIYEDFEDIVRFYLPCAGEYYLGCGARLSIDTFYREFVYTVAQIVEFATLEKCPVQVQNLWEQGTYDTEFVVAHAIEPNFALNGRGASKGTKVQVVPATFTFREVYWLKGIKCDQPLSKRGFRDKPFMAMLWSRVSNDPYGRSPCMDALGDTKQIQVETREKAEYIKKLTKPPMGAGVELRNEPASIIPGHITYMTTGGDGQKGGFWPLFQVNPAALSPMVEDIKSVAARIDKCLFVDVFMAITQMQGVQPRNELELTKRDLERLQKLGPVIDLVEAELKLCIQRVLSILQRRRMLKPMPKSLQGQALKIEFVNIARIAQRSATSVAMKDFFATMGGLSSAAKAAGVPDPLRVVDLDKSARKYGDVNNFPSDCLFTPEQVLEQDKARQQATQQQQMPGQAAAAVDAAKTLADTKIAPGNALSALMPGL